MIRNAAASAVMLGCALAAQADVVYNWQEVAPTAELVGSGGQLVISDDAWRAGSVSYTAAPCGPSGNRPGCMGYEDSPVLSLAFGTGVGDPRAELITDLRMSALGGPPNVFELRLRPDGLIDGRIAGGSPTGSELLEMAGLGTWTIGLFSTDRLLAPCSVTSCSGATGQWVLNTATVPPDAGQVPEPGILPLMALASIGLGMALRRRCR